MKLSYKYCTFDLPIRWLRGIKRHMRWVRAAGGIITDDEGNMLLIRRNNRWDLPKGKVEDGETLLQAALREVQEETGITPLPTTHHPLPIKTYHIFNLYGGWHLKQTSWFALHATGSHLQGAPQQEEGITEVAWVAPDEWYSRLQHSYGTLKTLSSRWIKSAK